MNSYDFDKTIYDGDSSIQFYLYCLKRRPSLAVYFPIQLVGAVMLFLRLRPKTECKELFYRYFRGIPDIDRYIEDFWNERIVRIKQWYKDIQKEDDVIISASPEFLLAPACKRLGIQHLIATRVNKKTGVHTGINCHGEEKVRRFYERFPNAKVENFYSDSLSDSPMAHISNKAFLVDGDELSDWPR